MSNETDILNELTKFYKTLYLKHQSLSPNISSYLAGILLPEISSKDKKLLGQSF